MIMRKKMQVKSEKAKMKVSFYSKYIIFIGLLISVTAYAQYSYIPMSIQMRDDKYLAADLYTIDTLVPKPMVLIQTPYNKFWYRFFIGSPEWQIPFDSINYNYLVVDWRGFYGSAPAESLGYDRGLDGYDLVEFIASQQWSNGEIGTWGASALGVIQFMTAKHRPPHLTCCVPRVSDYKTAYTDYYYGGDYLKELSQMRDSLGFVPESLILAHYKYDTFWIIVEMLTDYPESINVPMLLVTGWYDHNDDAPLNAFHALRDTSDPAVRDKHKFSVGPWTHSGVGRLQQGELTYPNAVDSLRAISLRMFDYYLRGIQNGYENEPVMRYYQMGENVWNTTNDWYTESDRTDTLYLNEDGVLSLDPPAISNPPDSLLFNPRDPSPSIGGNRFNPFDPSVIVGPRDQQDSVEARSDVVIYTTSVLTEPLIVKGNIQVKLYVSSDCEDTDMSVRITDVYPDGRSMLITEGIRRMRFRNTYTNEELMVPGDTYSVFVELKNVAYTFLPNHQVRVIISSSDYPIYDINLNNGDSLYVPGDTVVATNKIYHEPNILSLVILKTKTPAGIQETIRTHNITFTVSRIVFRTHVNFEVFLLDASPVELNLFDVSGRKVKTLMHKNLPAGQHQCDFNAAALPAGVYFAHLAVENLPVKTLKLICIK